MTLKVKEYAGGVVRNVITGMVVSTPALAKIAARWEPELFGKGQKEPNLIGGWCVAYLNKYGRAPDIDILPVFQSWAAAPNRDPALVQGVEDYLRFLSAEREQASEDVNPDYVVDEASKLFNAARAKDACDAVRGLLDAGRVEDALTAMNQFAPVELGASEIIDVDLDEAANAEIFAERTFESLVCFPGALGEFYGQELCRDGFISYMAPEKTGKSFFLLDLAHRAREGRRKVLFFSVGDMSRLQVLRRLAIRRAGLPKEAKTVKKPIRIWIPAEDRFACVETKEKALDGLDLASNLKAARRLQRRQVRSLESYFKLHCYANNTATVKMLDADIVGLKRNGWVPDVVVIDYADILAPPPGVHEHREQINVNWKQLRALAQTHHCLVVTATQSDTDSYGREFLGRDNFSDDKRKNAHVTGMIGINQLDREKEIGVYRLNWVELREAEFHSKRCVHVAGCLDLGNPCMVSVRGKVDKQTKGEPQDV